MNGFAVKPPLLICAFNRAWCIDVLFVNLDSYDRIESKLWCKRTEIVLEENRKIWIHLTDKYRPKKYIYPFVFITKNGLNPRIDIDYMRLFKRSTCEFLKRQFNLDSLLFWISILFYHTNPVLHTNITSECSTRKGICPFVFIYV